MIDNDAPQKKSDAGTSRRTFLRTAATLGIGAGMVAASSESVCATGDASRYTYSVMSGTDHETTVYVYESGRSGPTTLVVGGIHGDEPAGYRAADKIAEWAVESGSLVVVPRANVAAIQAGDHPWNNDLNRKFPGWNADCYTPLARALWSVVKETNPDFVFDLHSSYGVYGSSDGGLGQALFPTSVGNAREFAESVVDAVNGSFSLDTDMSFSVGDSINGSHEMFMDRVAAVGNCAGILCETSRKADSVSEEVDWHLACIEQVMAQYGQQRLFGSASTDGPVHEISITGTGNETEYELTVSGSLSPQANVSSDADVTEDSARGTVQWRSDNYKFTGHISSFRVVSGDDDVVLWLDGSKYHASDFPSGASTDSSETEHVVSITGTGRRTEYEFAVSGSLTPKSNLNRDDAISGNVAHGNVYSLSDTYTFTGEITYFEVVGGDEDVALWLDGNKYYASDFPTKQAASGPSPGDSSTTHGMSVTGTGTTTEYEFGVSGGLDPQSNVDSDDTVSSDTAHGTVQWKSDNYTYTGELTYFDVVNGDEDLVVWIDAKKYHASDFPSKDTTDSSSSGSSSDGSTSTSSGSEQHGMSITGTGNYTKYQFTVSGTLTPKSNINSDDTVSSNSATGTVEGLSDNYDFTGEITAFDVIDGDENVVIWLDGSKYHASDFPSSDSSSGSSSGDSTSTGSSTTHGMSVTGTGNTTEYAFGVSGSLTPKSNVNSDDTVSSRHAHGTVSGLADDYTFTGEVKYFDVVSGDEDVVIWIDGSKYHASDFPSKDTTDSSSGSTDTSSGDSSGDPSTTHGMSIVGTGNTAEYEFGVSGDIDPQSNVDSDDTVSSDTAHGTVQWKSDNYRFTGELTYFEVVSGDEDVVIWIDSKKYHASDFPSKDTTSSSGSTDTSSGDSSGGSSTTHGMSVVGTGNKAEYEFGVSGDIDPQSNVDSDDSVSTDTVHGTVQWKSDNYHFTGELTYFDVVSGDEDVVIWIDSKKYHASDFPSKDTTSSSGSSDDSTSTSSGSEQHGMSITGTGNYTKYEFEVTGDLSPGDNLNGADVAWGDGARGTVDSMSDDYTFTGKIAYFDVIDGDENVVIWLDGRKYTANEL